MKVLELELPDDTHRALVDRAHAELRQPRLHARLILEQALGLRPRQSEVTVTPSVQARTTTTENAAS